MYFYFIFDNRNNIENNAKTLTNEFYLKCIKEIIIDELLLAIRLNHGVPETRIVISNAYLFEAFYFSF